MILIIVSTLGLTTQASILATDECGIPHLSAKSLCEMPNSFLLSIIALMIEANSSISSISCLVKEFAFLASFLKSSHVLIVNTTIIDSTNAFRYSIFILIFVKKVVSLK